MLRCIRSMTVRGAAVALCSFGVMLSAISCRDESSAGPTDPPTVAEGEPAALASAAAPALSFYQVSAGFEHTCGVTMDNRVYCWGDNANGKLGDGTETSRHKPVRVATELLFRQVSAGTQTTCGVTTAYRVYCWGHNGQGTLGNGTTIHHSTTPVAAAGGRQFRQVETKNFHTCAVGVADSRAYCWGWNAEGQLGDGTTTDRTVPVAVTGTLQFREVRTGSEHTCGVTTDDRAFCWGLNRQGQLGDRTEVRRRTKPALVADGHRFRQLAAGDYHNCAVRTDNRAFCWGNGTAGQIGNGKTYLSFWPRPVSGGLFFDRVTGGMAHSCGETTTNRAYCWGYNGQGMLGDGTTQRRLTPVAVAGGHFFSQLSAGSFHTCGKTDAGQGYCWGENFNGQLGDGTTEKRFTPVAVVGPS
jgi:alpha-tubulin suppressor-like RCC1 family protein